MPVNSGNFDQKANDHFNAEVGGFTEITEAEIRKGTFNVKSPIRTVLIAKLGKNTIPRSGLPNEKELLSFRIWENSDYITEKGIQQLACKFSKPDRDEMSIYFTKITDNKLKKGDVWFIFFREGLNEPYFGIMSSDNWERIYSSEKEFLNQEEQSFLEDDLPELPPEDVVAYNELRSCADLVRMYKKNILEIQPDFQRDIVWPETAQTRFIDSLIKQLPIPSMCFSLDQKLGKWQVIDGLQRMNSIIKFLSDDNWKLSVLKDINPKISGKTVAEIRNGSSELKLFYERVENLTLPITILRCDYTKKSHTNFLFTVFHRLNTGGLRLTNQEIRNCIYGGSFNNLIKRLNKNPHWIILAGIESNQIYRFAKEELILRFFAYYDKLDSYKGKLASFLNDYMSTKTNIKPTEIQIKEELFNNTVKQILEKIFIENVPEKMSNTLLETLMYGVGKNIDHITECTSDQVQEKYEQLLQSSVLSEENLKEGLSTTGKVKLRLETSKKVFSEEA